jgi:hypothetical protein
MNVENHGGMISTGENFDSITRALAILPADTVAKQEELTKKIMNLVFEVSSFILRRDFLTCRKILRRRADGFTSLQREACFVALKNPSLSAKFEPSNYGSNGKHANHYTTEDD